MLLEVLARFPGVLAPLLFLQPSDDGIKYFTLKDPDPDPSLAWFILNAFFLIAVVLAVTIGIAVALGSFRLWLLERYPNNPFNGAPTDDVAQTFRLTDEPARPRSTVEGSGPSAEP
jgi:hypothetical protein